MRVTKAIREYVEEEITKKYQAKRDAIGQEYETERKLVDEKLDEILSEANAKAEEYLQSVRFVSMNYRTHCNPFGRSGRICQPETEDINAKERSLLDAKRNAKIKQVLFDLELGETTKAELKEVLDSITID